MSTTIITNGNPQAVLHGVDDQSVPALVPAPVSTPINLPLIFDYASKGPVGKAFMVSGDSLLKMYGSDVIDLKGEHTTINTPFLKMFNEAANPVLFQRVAADDATHAHLRHWVETRTYSDRIEIEHRISGFDEDSPYGAASIYEPEYDGQEFVTKIYPLWDFQVPYVGKSGNNIGYRLACLNDKSANPVNRDIVAAIGARLFELQFVEQTVPGVSPSIVKSLTAQTSVMFSFNNEAYYQPTRRDLGVKDVVMPAYRNISPPAGFMPEFGPVEDFLIYEDNLKALTQAIFDVVYDAQDADSEINTPDDIDFLTGLKLDGSPYDKLTVAGEVFSMNHTHYMSGGSDGELSDANYDALVRKEMIAFGEGSVDYLDILRYPSSTLWDAGFSVDTKEALCNYMGRLKNTNVILTTHVYDQGTNDMATEESMKLVLSGFLRAHPESTKYGTAAFRGHVVGHSMDLVDSAYKKRVPVSYDLALKTALFAGAETGVLKASKKFTRGELTIIESGTNINLTYKPKQVYSSDWDVGLIHVRSYDQYRFNFPALYTVYGEDRSILKGYFNALIAANLELVCTRVWAEMSGVSDMTEEQIIKEVNARITTKTQDAYAGIVRVIPDAYFTAEDRSNGYSVSVDVYMYGNVPKGVFQFTIIAKRQEG